MEKLASNRQHLLQALAALEEGITSFKKCIALGKSPVSYLDYESAERVFRDSMIQRFECGADLFWKYLKKYCETFEPVEFNSPVPVVKMAFRIGVLSEAEAGKALEICQSRNQTSHIYKEEMAEQLAHKIPLYYETMYAVAQRLEPR